MAVHALSLLALWYRCNMHIQLLYFKYDICHKEFKPKSAAVSWNATLSCLLSSDLAIPHGQLHMRIASFYETLKISLALHTWRPLHALLELLLNIKGPHDLNYIKIILSSDLAIPLGQLCMCMASFYETLKISLALHTWRPLHALLELLINIKGPRDLNYIQSQWYSYALWSGIWVFSRLLHIWGYSVGMLQCYQKQWKNTFLLRILKLPRIRMWQPRNQ